MITRFADAIENQVPLHQITAAESIVEVNTCSWPIEMDIVGNHGPRCYRLKPHRRLLLPKSKLSHDIICDCGVVRLFTATAVWPNLIRQLLGAVFVQALSSMSPCKHGCITDPSPC